VYQAGNKHDGDLPEYFYFWLSSYGLICLNVERRVVWILESTTVSCFFFSELLRTRIRLFRRVSSLFCRFCPMLQSLFCAVRVETLLDLRHSSLICYTMSPYKFNVSHLMVFWLNKHIVDGCDLWLDYYTIWKCTWIVLVYWIEWKLFGTRPSLTFHRINFIVIRFFFYYISLCDVCSGVFPRHFSIWETTREILECR